MKTKDSVSVALRGVMFVLANVAIVLTILYFMGVNGLFVLAALILGSKLSSRYESLKFKTYPDIILILVIEALVLFSNKWIPENALSLISKSFQSYVPSTDIFHAMLSTTTSVIALSVLALSLSVVISNKLTQYTVAFKEAVIDKKIQEEKLREEMV